MFDKHLIKVLQNLIPHCQIKQHKEHCEKTSRHNTNCGGRRASYPAATPSSASRRAARAGAGPGPGCGSAGSSSAPTSRASPPVSLTLCAAPSAVSRQARNYSARQKRESRKMTQANEKSSHCTRGASHWPSVTHHLSFIAGPDTQSRVCRTLTQWGAHRCRLIPGLCRPPRNPPSTGVCSPPPAPSDHSLLPRSAYSGHFLSRESGDAF